MFPFLRIIVFFMSPGVLLETLQCHLDCQLLRGVAVTILILYHLLSVTAGATGYFATLAPPINCRNP